MNTGLLSMYMKCSMPTCVKETNNRYAIYCSNQCQADHRWHKVRLIIEQDKIDTLNHGVEHSGSIAKRYLIEKYGNKCMKCNWAETNIYSNKIPIEIDHIDGNCTNNKLCNLQLLCPNCHSLTSSYKGNNKRSGNKSARYSNWKRRFKE